MRHFVTLQQDANHFVIFEELAQFRVDVAMLDLSGFVRIVRRQPFFLFMEQTYGTFNEIFYGIVRTCLDVFTDHLFQLRLS